MNAERFAHWANCSLWLMNAACWGFWAHAPLMAVGSLVAAGLAGWLAKTADTYTYRR